MATSNAMSNKRATSETSSRRRGTKNLSGGANRRQNDSSGTRKTGNAQANDRKISRTPARCSNLPLGIITLYERLVGNTEVIPRDRFAGRPISALHPADCLQGRNG